MILQFRTGILPIYKRAKIPIFITLWSENIMNIIHYFLQLIVATSAFVSGARLGGKGNMRGVRTRYSGLSPKEVAVLKFMLQRKRYGRFA